MIADAPQVWALELRSLGVRPEHKDAIVVTGSHGGLLGSRPETALKYDVLGALYNAWLNPNVNPSVSVTALALIGFGVLWLVLRQGWREGSEYHPPDDT